MQPPVRAQRLTSLVASLVASLVVAVVGAGVLLVDSSGASAPGLLRVVGYLAVWLVVVIAPGVLLWRALAGPSTAETELGAGAVTGIAVLLISWLLATGVGHSGYAVLGPLLVVAAVVAHPRLRPLLRPRRDAETSTRPQWWVAMAVLSCLAIYRVSLTILKPSVLPPGPSALAADTWYCLGIAQQLNNGFPVADPTYVGGEIKYHWFSLAVITATSQIAGTDLIATLLHLWFVPFVVIWLAVISAVVRTLLAPYEASHTPARWWGWGPLAAALVVLFQAAVIISRAVSPALGNGLNSGSASGAFGGLFVAGLTIPAAAVVRAKAGFFRSGAGRGTLALLALLAVAASGTKPTVLPLVAAGFVVVAGLKLITRASGWLVPTVVSVCLLAVYAAAGRVVIGSSEGVRIQPFAILASDRSYPLLFDNGAPSLVGAGGFVLPALAEHRPGAVEFVLALLFLFLMAQLMRLLGVLALRGTQFRGDPAAWWCAAAVCSGYLITFLILHSGFSQQWFALNVSGISIALTVAVVAVSWPAAPARSAWVWALATATLGVVGGIVSLTISDWSSLAGQRPSLLARVMPYAGLLVVLAGWTRLATRRVTRPPRRSRRLGWVPIVFLLLVGAGSPAATSWLRDRLVVPITNSPAAVVTEDQQAAALWLRSHSAARDVVVSNIFCRPVRYQATCDHQTVWVSALTGRRLVLDGWIYTEQSAAQYDGSKPMRLMPSPFPDLLQLSLQVVQHPSRRSLCEVSSRYSARWIFADREATAISPKLTTYAALRFSNPEVDVYEIDPAHLGCPGP